MVKLTDFPGIELQEALGPLPELPDKIWDYILDLATRATPHKPVHRFEFPTSPANATRKAILRVNKQFNVRVESRLHSVTRY